MFLPRVTALAGVEPVDIGNDVLVVAPADNLFGAIVVEPVQPRCKGDIGNRVAARDPVATVQLAVDHVQQSLGLRDIAFTRSGILDLGTGEFVKIAQLPEHRPDAAHLEHQPLDRLVAADSIAWQQLAGFLGKIDQDRPAFEQAHRCTVWPERVDDGWDLAVGVQGEERGAFHIRFRQRYFVRLVRQPHFFERYRNLDTVRSGE